MKGIADGLAEVFTLELAIGQEVSVGGGHIVSWQNHRELADLYPFPHLPAQAGVTGEAEMVQPLDQRRHLGLSALYENEWPAQADGDAQFQVDVAVLCFGQVEDAEGGGLDLGGDFTQNVTRADVLVSGVGFELGTGQTLFQGVAQVGYFL